MDKKTLNAVKESIRQGFSWATREGPLCEERKLLFHFSSWTTIYCPVARFEETLYQQYGAHPSSEQWALYMFHYQQLPLAVDLDSNRGQGSSLWSFHELSTSAFKRLSLDNTRLANTWQSPNVDSCRMSMGPPVSTV